MRSRRSGAANATMVAAMLAAGVPSGRGWFYSRRRDPLPMPQWMADAYGRKPRRTFDNRMQENARRVRQAEARAAKRERREGEWLVQQYAHCQHAQYVGALAGLARKMGYRGTPRQRWRRHQDWLWSE